MPESASEKLIQPEKQNMKDEVEELQNQGAVESENNSKKKKQLVVIWNMTANHTSENFAVQQSALSQQLSDHYGQTLVRLLQIFSMLEEEWKNTRLKVAWKA